MYQDIYPLLLYYTEYFHCPENPLCSIYSSLLRLTSGNHWYIVFTFCIVLSFPKCYIVGIIQYVSCSNKVLSLSNMPFSFLHVFLWLDSFLHHFFKYKIMFHCLDEPHLCICSPTKGHSVTSKFWQFWKKLLYTLMCRFLHGHVFSCILVNTKECYCWIIW